MLEDLLHHIGVEDIRTTGNEVRGRCPRHEERTGRREQNPRHWSVNRITGRHHCFSCGYRGGLIRLINEVTGVGIWEANKLIHDFDVELNTEREERTWTPPPEAKVEEHVHEYGPVPDRPIEVRRLRRQSVERYGVRWDPEDVAWVLPIFGPNGSLWGYQTKSTERVRNYPPGVKKSYTLFGLNLLAGTSPVLVVESPLDVVYLDGLGYPAVASFGASVSIHQMRLLVAQTDHIMLALDNDTAGQTETQRLVEHKWHHRLTIEIFNYRHFKGKDPGELNHLQVQVGIDSAALACFWS
jgi:DNA primase